VFFVIGGVYIVDALVFGAAALLQIRRRQRRSSLTTTTTTAADYVRRTYRTKLPTSCDVRLSSVDATSPAVSVPPLFSTYGAVVAKCGSGTAHVVSGDGDNDERRKQSTIVHED